MNNLFAWQNGRSGVSGRSVRLSRRVGVATESADDSVVTEVSPEWTDTAWDPPTKPPYAMESAVIVSKNAFTCEVN